MLAAVEAFESIEPELTSFNRKPRTLFTMPLSRPKIHEPQLLGRTWCARTAYVRAATSKFCVTHSERLSCGWSAKVRQHLAFISSDSAHSRSHSFPYRSAIAASCTTITVSALARLPSGVNRCSPLRARPFTTMNLSCMID